MYSRKHLEREQLEMWLIINIWSPLIDQCFHENTFDCVRGEGESVSSKARKQEAENKRFMRGRKCDLIVRKKTSKNSVMYEFACAEVTKICDEHSLKWMFDSSLKLPKTLKDMLFRLSKATHNKRPLKTIGFAHRGLTFYITTMTNPKGNIYLYRTSEALEVGSDLSKWDSTVPAIILVYRAKLALRKVDEMLNNIRESDKGERLNRWKARVNSALFKTINAPVSSTMSTPLKPKRKLSF